MPAPFAHISGLLNGITVPGVVPMKTVLMPKWDPVTALQIIDDSLATPPSGQARIRVLHGASNAQTLDVATANGTKIASGLAFATTSDYVDVPAGATTLQVSTGGEPPTDLPVDVAPGAVYSLEAGAPDLMPA